MTKQIIIFIAPPGAGKGTQANLLAEKFGFTHIETSKIIEAKLKDADPNDPIMIEEKRKWLSGELNTPAIIKDWLLEKVRELAAENKGVVLSASPRTLYEVKVEMPEFEKLYSRDNIKIFYITLSEEESMKRNSGRRICEKNRHPIPNFPEYQNLTTCPQDGSPLVTRALDKPEVIRERYGVYKAETEPVLDYLKKDDYKVIEINGEQPIEKVFSDIMGHFEK